MTRLVRGHIENNTYVNQEVIYEAPHETYLTTRHHYGTRIVFDADGYLYFAIGDRGVQNQAQDLTRPNGKVHRIHTRRTHPQRQSLCEPGQRTKNHLFLRPSQSPGPGSQSRHGGKYGTANTGQWAVTNSMS